MGDAEQLHTAISYETAMKSRLQGLLAEQSETTEFIIDPILDTHAIVDKMIALTQTDRSVGPKRAGRVISEVLFNSLNSGSDSEQIDTLRTVEGLRSEVFADREYGHSWYSLVGKYATNYALSAYSAQHGSPDHSLFKRYGISYDGRRNQPNTEPRKPLIPGLAEELVAAAERKHRKPFRRLMRLFGR